MLEATVAKGKLPDRSIGPLFNASMGLRLRNATYRAEADVSDLVASRDLKALVDADLLVPIGAKRGRYYTRTPLLADIDAQARSRRAPEAMEDPFDAARAALQPSIWPQPGPGG